MAIFLTEQGLAMVQAWCDVHGVHTKQAICAHCQQVRTCATPKALIRSGVNRVAGLPPWSGRACLSCGYIHQQRPIKNKALRQSVYEADDFVCVYCGAGDDLSLDHIVPQVNGGDDSFENLVTCCRSCNTRKRDGRITLTPAFGPRYA